MPHDGAHQHGRVMPFDARESWGRGRESSGKAERYVSDEAVERAWSDLTSGNWIKFRENASIPSVKKQDTKLLPVTPQDRGA